MNKDKKTLITISVITVFLIGVIGVSGSVMRHQDLKKVEENKQVITESLTKYSREEVATHNTRTNCWSSIDGYVYNMTEFINLHPGGDKAVAETCGIDGTASFNEAHHGSARKLRELQKYMVGVLNS